MKKFLIFDFWLQPKTNKKFATKKKQKFFLFLFLFTRIFRQKRGHWIAGIRVFFGSPGSGSFWIDEIRAFFLIENSKRIFYLHGFSAKSVTIGSTGSGPFGPLSSFRIASTSCCTFFVNFKRDSTIVTSTCLKITFSF